MEIVNSRAEAYAARYTSPTDALISEVEHYTMQHHAHANMLSGAVQGKLLEAISRILRPRRILEIGTFTGYSALCLAQGLADDGVLHTIEIREEDAALAASFFARSSHKNRIILHRGNALDIIPGLKEDWDLVFIDADKTGYIDYYELTLPLLKAGGVMLADNVLFHGEVLEEVIRGKSAKAIQAFNDHVAADVRVTQVLLTVRDGLMWIMKK